MSKEQLQAVSWLSEEKVPPRFITPFRQDSFDFSRTPLRLIYPSFVADNNLNNTKN